jgi:serine/threonine-protein kinase
VQTQPLTPIALDQPDPLVGQRLGDFVVEAAVAAGGMGVVYRARHPLIGRLAAIKVLKPEFAADREQTDRFLKEAQSLAAIKHRGIIEIIGFGNTTDGRQYMATEFLEGESLEKVIAREAPMGAMHVLSLVDEMLNALSAAHKSQVVHRDLKPSNVFLATQSTGERIVKLLDFGLAKQSPVTLADVQEGPLAKASLVAGTPEYIAPEQARGLAAGPRTDLYCVGVMMFEMLSGTLPFKAESVIEMLKKHVYEPAPKLSERVSNLPEALVDLVTQLLEKDPEKRPGSAELVRQTAQRITRQMQQESTIQRPNPLRLVPAPFHPEVNDAPTPRIDPKLIVTEPVIRPVAEAKRVERRRRWPLALLGIFVLGGVAWWLRPSPVATPLAPLPPKPKVERLVEQKVEPAVPLAPAPVPVEAQEDVLGPLPVKPPKKEKVPKAPEATAAPVAVAPEPPPLVSANTCVVDEAWRRSKHGYLEGAQTDMVKVHPDRLDAINRGVAEWDRKIDAMGADEDCAQFEASLRAWVQKESK